MTLNKVNSDRQNHFTFEVIKYIEQRYGSIVAFFLLKYLLEHKLAREKDGFTSFELSFGIAPSIILTPKTLCKIVSKADGTTLAEAEKGLEVLITKNLVKVDPETNIISLVAPINSIANVFLKKNGTGFEQVNGIDEANAVLLSAGVAPLPKPSANEPDLFISAVPDLLIKNEKGEISIVGLKYRMESGLSRIYPPNWCCEKECIQCNFLSCDKRIRDVFKTGEYQSVDFQERPKYISYVTISIYFGYCKRLAHFFLRYPQIENLSNVVNNFHCTKDDMPARVDIPRIFLDMLTRGIDEAPTDEVFKLKFMLTMKASKTTQAKLSVGDIEKDIVIPQEDIDAFHHIATDWQQKVLNNNSVSFEMTSDLIKCKYCFLENCDKEVS